MRSNVRTGAAAALLLVLSVPAWAGPAPSRTETQVKIVSQYLKEGHKRLESSTLLDKDAPRLNKLDGAISWLRRARDVAKKSDPRVMGTLRALVEQDLCTALNDQAVVYYSRNSLNLAKKRTREVLTIDPCNERALVMADRIAMAGTYDVYDRSQGTTSISRIRDRRVSSGIPLRDRGVARRR